MTKPPLRGLRVSRPVSRILSRVIIPLGSYPGPGRATSWRALFALPGTGFGEPPRRRDAGGLLPHRFTLTGGVSGERAAGGLLSVPLSVGFRRLACASVLPFGVRTFLDQAPRHPTAITRPAACILSRRLEIRARARPRRRAGCRTPGRTRCPRARASRTRRT